MTISTDEPDAEPTTEAPGEVEEITLGLPSEGPPAVSLEEHCLLNRYLLQSMRQLERDLLEIELVDVLLSNTIQALRRTLGCLSVRLSLHDPIGELDSMIKDRTVLGDDLHMTADSTAILAPFEASETTQWLTASQVAALDLPDGDAGSSSVLAIPLIESRAVVGAIYCISPRLDLIGNDNDTAFLGDFGAFLPLALRRTIASQRASELMLLDPETHVANRHGLERDLERELGRARRMHKSVSLAAAVLCGLQNMGNLSQRHLRAMVLRQIADRIGHSLRATDSMGRLDVRCFSMLITDAPLETVHDIAWRCEQDLSGLNIDDGMGGVIEIDPRVVYISVEPAKLPDASPGDLASAMIKRLREWAQTCQCDEHEVVELSLVDPEEQDVDAN